MFKPDIYMFASELFKRRPGDASGGPGTDGEPTPGGTIEPDVKLDKNGVPIVDKIVETRDPVTGATIKIPAEINSLIGHIISTTRKTEEAKYKPILETIEKENTEMKDIKAEFEKMREASMTAEQKAAENAKKVIEEAKKTEKSAREEADKWRNSFEKSTIRNDIYSSFGDFSLCNPAQVAILFEAEGTAKISEVVDDDGRPIGEYETRVTLVLEDDKGRPERVEGRPQDLFRRWIKLERNTHHIKNPVTPGGGARTVGGKAGIRAQELQNLNPVDRINAARSKG